MHATALYALHNKGTRRAVWPCAGTPWVKPSHEAAPAPAPLPLPAPAASELVELPTSARLALAGEAASPPGLPAALEAAAEWPPDVRCYAGELHSAEARVAAALARLAGQASRLPDAHDERVRRWLSRNEKETGAPRLQLAGALAQLCEPRAWRSWQRPMLYSVGVSFLLTVSYLL